MAKRISEQEQYFARWLNLTLDNSGIKRGELAQQLGVHASAISQWAGGKRPIPRDKVAPLARILDVDPLALTVTAGIIDADVARADPLPMPSPDALVAKMRKTLSAAGLMTPDGLDRLAEVIQVLRETATNGGNDAPPDE